MSPTERGSPSIIELDLRIGRPRTGETRRCAGCGKVVYLKQSELRRGWKYCGECRNKLSSPPARVEKGGRLVAGFTGSICSKCHSTMLMKHPDGLECLQCGRIVYIALPKVSRNPKIAMK